MRWLLATVVMLCVGCATVERERVKLDQQTEDRGCKPTQTLEIAPGWPTSRLFTYALVHCEKITTEKWKVTRRTELPLLATGALVLAGGVATGVTGLFAVQVGVNHNNPNTTAQAGIDLATQVAFWGGLVLGAGLNLAIILGLEGLTDSDHEELVPTTSAFNREVTPIDGEVRVSSDAAPLTMVNGQLVVDDAALIQFRGSEVRVNGEPPVLTDEMRTKLESAQGCAITFAKPDRPPGSLSDAELKIATSAAHRCLDIGVWDADPKLNALNAEERRRRN